MDAPSNDNTQFSGMRNTIKRLNMQAQRRAALPDRAIAESDLGDVQPWGVAALLAMGLGIIGYAIARAMNNVRRPFLKAEDNAKLAKQYAKQSQKLAKQAKGFAAKAKAAAKRHPEEVQMREASAHRARLLREVKEERRVAQQDVQPTRLPPSVPHH